MLDVFLHQPNKVLTTITSPLQTKLYTLKYTSRDLLLMDELSSFQGNHNCIIIYTIIIGENLLKKTCSFDKREKLHLSHLIGSYKYSWALSYQCTFATI